VRELAGERPRFGYRRLYIFLRREKAEDGTLRWRVNHKRVYRLYREEGLAMQRRKRKRFRAEARVPLALPTRANGSVDDGLDAGEVEARDGSAQENVLARPQLLTKVD
jgi:HTH-like domain